MTSIYLAGKIAANDWRHTVVPSLRDTPANSVSWQPISTSIKGMEYIGPFFTGCDHGCAHGQSQHGFLKNPICGEQNHWDGCPRQDVSRLCLDAIQRADIFFAWIGPDGPMDDVTAYGTLAEIGYACGQNTLVVTAAPSLQTDVWFAHHMADHNIAASTPVEAVMELARHATWLMARRK